MDAIKIRHIQVLLDDHGPDTIFFRPELETAHPNLKYEPLMKMNAQAGYGVEWVRKVFGREPDEIVDLRMK